ncbi:MAG: 4Fe-4S dicluster domain-containing protein [Firmicutes bacterium]|nr:4Fe-4S dicluster domain-containing protein [Bacillota bacterium]
MSKAILTFNEAYCKGCELCVAACPKKVLSLNTSRVNAKGYNPVNCTDINNCIACAICAIICPDNVIKIEKEEVSK